MISEEAQELRRHLYMVRMDYQKAFDSVFHSWIMHALKLAKVPKATANAIISHLKHGKLRCNYTLTQRQYKQIASNTREVFYNEIHSVS